VIAGVILVQSVAVAVGALAGTVLPERVVAALSAGVFVAVGIWLWFGARDSRPGPEDGGPIPPGLGVTAVAGVALAFALGELGDKTQLATVALASRTAWTATLIGGIAGMIAANAIAIEIGVRVAGAVDRRRVQRVAAAVFLVVGLVLLVAP
jgi:putative Ca2+/H+ antiporter (TMEM165/GDT1 family)